jgi:hypothetical protein
MLAFKAFSDREERVALGSILASTLASTFNF